MPDTHGMGTTPQLPYSISLPPGIALLAPDVRAKPDPSQAVPRRALELTLPLSTGQGFGTAYGDRYEQTNHYIGAIALAIKPYLNAIRAAKFRVLQKNPRATVTKSMSYGHFSRDEEYQPADPDHPLCQILNRPNGDSGNWSMARECAYLALQYHLTGDAPVWTPFNDEGKPVKFFALTSATTQFTYPAGTNPLYPKGAYRVLPYTGVGSFSVAGGLYTGAILPAEEVHRLMDEHPWARGAGMSRLQAGGKEIDVLEALTRSRWSFFTEGPQLDAIITVPGASPEVTQDLQNRITRRHGGADNHGRRLLVVGGGGVMDKMNVQPIGMNAQEMGFLQSFDQAASVVLALFGVPKPVGIPSEVTNYATLYASKQLFYETGLTPFLLRMSDFLTTGLADPWSDEPGQLKIEAEPPPLGDLEMDEKQFQSDLQTGLVTWNQALRKRNLPPVGPEGDVPAPLYLKKLEAQSLPQPAPAGLMGDQSQQPGAVKQPDPLAALLGSKPNAPGDTPTGGAPPRPENPAGEGSLPPRPTAKREQTEIPLTAAKALACDTAMSTIDDAHGGALVPPMNRLARRKRKPWRSVVAKALKALEEGE